MIAEDENIFLQYPHTQNNYEYACSLLFLSIKSENAREMVSFCDFFFLWLDFVIGSHGIYIWYTILYYTSSIL